MVPQFIEPLTEQPSLQSKETEQVYLGSLLVDPSCIKLPSLALPDDLTDQDYRYVLESMLRLEKDGLSFDVTSIMTDLRLRDLPIGEAVLDSLEDNLRQLITNPYCSSTHIRTYSEQLKKLSNFRRVQEIGLEIAHSASPAHFDDPNQLLGIAQNGIFELSHRMNGKGTSTIGEALHSFHNNLDVIIKDGVLPGVPIGISKLDQIMGGLQKTHMTIMGGRPGMGKTALALNIALRAAKVGKRSIIFSLEMSDDQLVQRLMAMEGKLDSQRLKLGQLDTEEWAKFHDSIKVLDGLPITFSTKNTDMSIAMESRSIDQVARLDLIIIDYLQRIRAAELNGSNREQEVSTISRNIKTLAMELDVPILVLSSLSRNCEHRTDKHPVLADLRDSGSLEHDADEVWFLYREEVYKPDTEFPNILEIDMPKNRHGPTGIATCYFQKHTGRIVELETRKQPLD